MRKVYQVPHTLVIVNPRRVAIVNFTPKQRKLIKSQLPEFENTLMSGEYKQLSYDYVNALTDDVMKNLAVPEDIKKLTMLGCYAINCKFGLLGSRIQNRLGIIGIKSTNAADIKYRFLLKSEMLISSLDKYDTPTNTIDDLWELIKTMPNYPKDLDWIGHSLDDDIYSQLVENVRKEKIGKIVA